MALAVASLAAQDFPPPSAPALPATTGEPSSDVYKIGGRVSPPRILKKVEPHFSKEARIAHLQGTVVLDVTVGTDGKAHDLKAGRSLGFGLDESAIEAVSHWEFAPGLKGGQPVNVHASIEVNFRWLGREAKDKWHVQRISFNLPEGASRPAIEKVVPPKISDFAATPAIRLTFDIDEKGMPRRIPNEEGSNEGFSREVAAALAHWRFKPAYKDGHPISVFCTMDFVRED